ncbi:MAG TPA: DUF4197 domain-containing protein [Bacteroidia bacterium]|jgi:hypothetical protein|nr:DUF4197 domain-containing protein [Bacteroidia bacterium]
MNKKIAVLLLSVCVISAQAQSLKNKLKAAEKKAEQEVKDHSSSNGKLSNDDIIAGLKEALSTGTKNSTATASKVDGYLKNPAIFIPFPPEAEKIKTELINLGFKNKVDEFETSVNRAAEQAATSAAPIFLDAVKKMTVTDGLSILQGSDTAATHYLKQNTSAALTAQYHPIVKDALAKVNATAYWASLVKIYNEIPFVKKQNPDLEGFVTGKALNGLFHLVGEEETKIRKDPAAQVTDLLKKVFGKK